MKIAINHWYKPSQTKNQYKIQVKIAITLSSKIQIEEHRNSKTKNQIRGEMDLARHNEDEEQKNFGGDEESKVRRRRRVANPGSSSGFFQIRRKKIDWFFLMKYENTNIYINSMQPYSTLLCSCFQAIIFMFMFSLQ